MTKFTSLLKYKEQTKEKGAKEEDDGKGLKLKTAWLVGHQLLFPP